MIRETPVSALLDGGDQVGYYVAHRATSMAVEKAKKSGIAIVGANNTFYTGLFSYYMEMATREGLVAMAIGNGPGRRGTGRRDRRRALAPTRSRSASRPPPATR